jgi:uncharacterized protein
MTFVDIVMDGFEWEEDKAAINEVLHGISFEKARAAFDDPNAVDLDDPGHSDELETRYALIGMTPDYGLLFISYTYRDGNIRLISARKAITKGMIKRYERGY